MDINFTLVSYRASWCGYYERGGKDSAFSLWCHGPDLHSAAKMMAKRRIEEDWDENIVLFNGADKDDFTYDCFGDEATDNVKLIQEFEEAVEIYETEIREKRAKEEAKKKKKAKEQAQRRAALAQIKKEQKELEEYERLRKKFE